MASKVCICQICTCPERMHKCTYADNEEHLRMASLQHCRTCGKTASFAKRPAPYVPMGPMETATTYSSEFQEKPIIHETSVRSLKPFNPYTRPAAAMAESTTYNADYSGSAPITATFVTVRPNSYNRPMGEMILETTYNGAYQSKAPTDPRKLATNPNHCSYQRPMGPMYLGTTYNSDFADKRSDSAYRSCCPCCDPKRHGFVPQGEENGHTMFVKRF